MKYLFRLYRSDIVATLRLSYPIVIGQLGMVLMGVADTVMVGRLGAAELGAAGIATSIFMVVSIVGMGTLSVIAPQIATAKGLDDKAACGRLLRSGMLLSLVLSLVLGVILLLLQSYFEIFQQKPEINERAKDFLLIISISIIPLLLFNAVKQFSDGLSHTRIAMYITVVGLLINVFLNWLLIPGRWGFPAWGLNGAGVATLVARTWMAIIMVVYVWKSPTFHDYIRANQLQGSLLPLINKLFRLGLPGGLQYFFEVAAFAGAAIIIGWLGKYPLAAHQVAINLAGITYMMASGFSFAGAIRVGEAVGLGNQAKVVRAGSVALLMVGSFMVFCCVLFLTTNQLLISLYMDDPQVTEIATSLVIIAGFFQLSDGIQVVGLGILRGLADVNIPTFITLLAYWLIGLPLGYLLAFKLGMGAQGIWIGLLVGLSISAILLTTRFYHLASVARRLVSQSEKSLFG
ncbi:MAG: MATE family efflux transporter [Bacteroidota bacterium]